MKDTDRNFFSLADVDGRTLEGLSFGLGDAPDFDDTLKFSHAQDVVGRRLWVRGGTENAIDMNRCCAGIRIEDSLLIGGDQCSVVIKGGSQDITLARMTIVPADPEPPCDIELGGWSDQSNAPTRRVTLQDVTRRDGRPVRIAVGHAERPIIIGGNCRVLFWRSLGLKLFWLARRLQAAIGNLKSQI